MLYELHLTVSPDTDINEWRSYCNDYDAKPLRIELEGDDPENPVQIMFAAVTEGDDKHAEKWMNYFVDGATTDYSFKIVREKLEVPLDKALPYQESAAYHECHVKSLIHPDDVETVLDRAFSLGWVASRNGLFTHDEGLEKWYFTQRNYGDSIFAAAQQFQEQFAQLDRAGFVAVRMESETVIVDSNEGLDAGWVE